MRSRDAMDYIDDHIDDAHEMLLADIFKCTPSKVFHVAKLLFVFMIALTTWLHAIE